MLPLAIVFALGGVVLSGIVSGVRDGGDRRTTAAPRSRRGSSPATASRCSPWTGYRDLLDAIEDETGSTEVFDAVLYPTYAVGSLPLDSSTQRDASFSWDGALETRDETTTSPYARHRPRRRSTPR